MNNNNEQNSINTLHIPTVDFLGSLDVTKTERIGKRTVFYLEDPDYRISIGTGESDRIVHYKDHCFTMDDYDEEDRKKFIGVIYALFLCACMDKLSFKNIDKKLI